MPGHVEVQSLEVLLALQADLHGFSERAQASLTAARSGLAQAEATMEQRWRERLARTRRCEAELERARDALRYAGNEDAAAAARRWVEQATRDLDKAAADLRNVQLWLDRLVKQADEFRHRAHQMERLITEHGERAAAFLRHRHAELQTYIGRVPTGDSAGMDGSAAAGALSSAGSAGLLGAPEEAKQFQRYQRYGDCAIVAQQMVLEKHTGECLSEDDLVGECIARGWAGPTGGTKFNSRGNLLEAHGVPVQRWTDGSATIETLQHELAQEHDVIVSLDAAPLYDLDKSYQHAIWVTGLDLAGGLVYVQDSNRGAPASYPLSQFLAAWEGSLPQPRAMISTKSAALRRY